MPVEKSIQLGFHICKLMILLLYAKQLELTNIGAQIMNISSYKNTIPYYGNFVLYDHSQLTIRLDNGNSLAEIRASLVNPRSTCCALSKFFVIVLLFTRYQITHYSDTVFFIARSISNVYLLNKKYCTRNCQ